MKANVQRLDDDLREKVCAVCRECFIVELHPTDPQCGGRWCDEALEAWLEEEMEKWRYRAKLRWEAKHILYR